MDLSPISIRKADLIVLDDTLEAITLRGVLESFNIEVRCHFVGHVKQLVSLLDGSTPLAPLVILCCHGDEDGMVLPELALQLEKDMPYHTRLTAADCAEFLDLKENLVINTGCCLGTK